MRSNLPTVIAELHARVLVPLQDMADGAACEAVAEAQAVRGRALMLADFAARQTPAADPWHPPARNYGHPLLEDTGALKDSGDCQPEGVSAAGYTLNFTYDDPKAIWQHAGTFRRGKRHIPPRPLLFTGATAGRWISDLNSTGQAALDRWMQERFK